MAGVTACGGGGSDGGSGGGGGSTGLTASAQPAGEIKALELTWEGAEQAAYFEVQVNPDGASGFTQADVNGDGAVDDGDDIGGDASSATLSLPLHLADLDNALYRIAAFDANGNEIAASDELALMNVAIDALIGYAKASNTGDEDRFGGAVAISESGDTVAVGAASEDGAGTGVGADPNDNSNDAGAVYVFERSGASWSQRAYVKASNTGRVDRFGASVALSDGGDTLAVGAPVEDSAATGVGADQSKDDAAGAGAVYVFQRGGNGWSQQAYVKASNTDESDAFGREVALSGDGGTLAVSAPFEDSAATRVGGDQTNNNAENAGAAYVFQRSGGNWSQQAYVKAAKTAEGDSFGKGLALSDSGDTLAVGATGESTSRGDVSGVVSCDQLSDGSIAEVGAAFVYRRSGDSWSRQACIKSFGELFSGRFGQALALGGGGDRLAVGAPGEAVYLYERSGTGWSSGSVVTAPELEVREDFGRALALNAGGDVLAVGAETDRSTSTGLRGDPTDDGADRAGGALVFARDGGSWQRSAYVKAPNTGNKDRFGKAIALGDGGETLVVGAPQEDSSATGIGGDQSDDFSSSSGAVYLY